MSVVLTKSERSTFKIFSRTTLEKVGGGAVATLSPMAARSVNKAQKKLGILVTGCVFDQLLVY